MAQTLRKVLSKLRPKRAARPGPSPAEVAARVNGGPPAPSGRHLAYAPNLDGDADPGEIVWTWVPYEDDPSQGKDRPVLVVGRQSGKLLGLMLSSKSDREGQRHWFALGAGAWDRENRPSWIRLDRVLEVDEDGIRREGAILPRDRFDAVAKELRTEYNWA
ncbi:type II toxin-antitoxin system PemK/MazF family toxin [Cryptosporangium japonicum]|uniref:PemK-like, MazF-like toxin of type II toxin-antitoxin system n=1 Tax=Cryptosporangium japonicum TaxID=80872 RepID=A0ABN0UP80_9ACTN